MVNTNEKRTPPVLMTPVCFSAIHELTGDRGARDIVNNFSTRHFGTMRMKEKPPTLIQKKTSISLVLNYMRIAIPFYFYILFIIL